MEQNSSDSTYDIVVMGGALAGGAIALLLRRHLPQLRVLIIERNPQFDWKVGESTVEISSYFLTRVLRLYDYLSREQLPKHGLRYWFHNGKVSRLREASETGSSQLPRLPSFQLDRAKLDEHVHGLAVREGAEVWRPAKILEVRLPEETGTGESHLSVEREGQRREIKARWVVDASGRSAILARKRGWLHPLKEHPTSAIWVRYTDVKDLDGPELAGIDPSDPWARTFPCSRRLATNHFTGYGYWIWFIPLHGGEMSVGVVWDRRMVEPVGRTPQDRLEWFLQGNPLTRQLIEGAKLVPDDTRLYAQLPYLVDRVAGKGWSSVGDAAGFLDPFYSPGIDQLGYSVSWSLELIKRSLKNPDPADFAQEIEEHNRCYAQFFRYFFETVYLDKYATMGDFNLMTAELLLDTCFYYFWNVWPAYRGKDPLLLQPPYYPPKSKYFRPILGFPHQRLVALARRKLKLGIYGNNNAGRRPQVLGFTLGLGTVLTCLKGIRYWLQAEAANLLSYVFRPRPRRSEMPGPMTDPARSDTPVPASVPPPPDLDMITIDGKAAQQEAMAAAKSESPAAGP
jgi:flavin-dependent dehydrogenase